MKTIDCTPMWEGIFTSLIEIVSQKGVNKNVKNEAMIELRRMAQAADKWNAHVKQMKQQDQRGQGYDGFDADYDPNNRGQEQTK